jgi:hypothetical protein
MTNISTYGAYKTGKLFDCCLTGEKETTTLKTLDCPPTYYNLTTDCKTYMTNYCMNKNMVDAKCLKLSIDSPDFYKDLLTEYCMKEQSDEYSHMAEPICNQWCKDNKELCTAILPYFCKDKYTGSFDDYTIYNDTCGCYYPANIYTPYYTDIQQKYNTPANFINSGIQCTHPFCLSAKIQKDDISKCTNKELIQCVQESMTLDKGNISGNINITGSCSDVFTNKDGSKITPTTGTTGTTTPTGPSTKPSTPSTSTGPTGPTTPSTNPSTGSNSGSGNSGGSKPSDNSTDDIIKTLSDPTVLAGIGGFIVFALFMAVLIKKFGKRN